MERTETTSAGTEQAQTLSPCPLSPHFLKVSLVFAGCFLQGLLHRAALVLMSDSLRRGCAQLPAAYGCRARCTATVGAWLLNLASGTSLHRSRPCLPLPALIEPVILRLL